MTRSQLVRGAVAVIAVLAAATTMGTGGAVAAPSASSVEWEVFQLEPLAPGEVTTVFDITEDGIAAGQSGDQPVVWTPSGAVSSLPVPAGYVGGVVFSLNDDEQAVGLVFTADEEARAVLWDAGKATLLGVDDLVGEIRADGVMLGIDLSDLSAGASCCLSGFVQAVGGPRFPLTAPDGVHVLPAALSDSGIVVGSAIAPGDLVIGAGWYQQYVFLIGGVTEETYLEPIDVISAPAVLAARNDAQGISSVLVDRTGTVIPLAGPSPIDLATDLNSLGVAVGAGGKSFEEGPEVGRLYVYGSAVALESLVDPSDHVGYDLNDPIALNDDFWIVGNSQDGSSWLLRPSTAGAAAASAALTGPAQAEVDEPVPPHRGEPPVPVDRRYRWRTDIG